MSNRGLASCGPQCSLTHNLINKLSVIVGECELLSEHTLDPECVQRLGIIVKTAQAMATELKRHDCRCSESESKEAGVPRRECQKVMAASARLSDVS